MRVPVILLCCILGCMRCAAQNAAPAAAKFIATLDSSQRLRALYPFDIDERYKFHFFPKDDRKGIMINDLTPSQKAAAFDLVKTCMSGDGVKKIMAIMQLENVLKAMEHRMPEDHFRDTGKYYFTVFGLPGDSTVWGWRLEGHHISFNFSSGKGQVVSGTPGFMGANPAIVREGPQKGTQVLKDEANMGFDLLRSLNEAQLKTARVDTAAPNEIITFVSRKAMQLHPEGLLYKQMTQVQQEKLLQLVRLYVNRYTRLFAGKMLKEIEKEGLNNLSFAWAGSIDEFSGKPHYYRIQGPTIIIEYDNSQNNANHVHSVVRDLLNDFGGDMLLQHYRQEHAYNH